MSYENIKKLRFAMGLEQAEFGKELAVTPGTVSNWENGRRVPRLRHARIMVCLAKKHKLKFTIEDFLS